ncbi:MAG: ScaI family restriction endonuclease [Rikenellaceae bacterium]|nr:ScaI family restriction endonuclease [Rikenellaceae bacterium]
MAIESSYKDKDASEWGKITDELISKHVISTEEIVETILKSWDDIFNSKIGSFYIGKDIYPSPQIMSFLLHELIPLYLSQNHPEEYKVGTLKTEKDIHCLKNCSMSIEIKGSSHPSQIFANRSYAQPQEGNVLKSKDGYYITVNFEKFEDVKPRMPKILLIRFGYLEHSDWIAQKSATGQQARLSPLAYKYKLKQIYPRVEKEFELKTQV